MSVSLPLGNEIMLDLTTLSSSRDPENHGGRVRLVLRWLNLEQQGPFYRCFWEASGLASGLNSVTASCHPQDSPRPYLISFESCLMLSRLPWKCGPPSFDCLHPVTAHHPPCLLLSPVRWAAPTLDLQLMLSSSCGEAVLFQLPYARAQHLAVCNK